MNSIEEEKVEKYLAEATNRLMDTQTFMQGLKRAMTLDKNILTRNGSSFAYQQGMLDVIEELTVYASGERSFQKDARQLLTEMAKESERKAKKDLHSQEIYG